MDIKLKNKRTSVFITSMLALACSLLLSCKSSTVENTAFNKIVHPREYVFDIFDIDESPKLKRERGTKKLEYSVDFSDYVKYDLPKAGDKLTLIYKGEPNKDVPGVINVSLGGLPANLTESYIFGAELKKKEHVENKISFILKQDMEEVIFNLKYDNPKTYLSVTLNLEEAGETTDTKAEKKELEKAIKRGQQIVEISTMSEVAQVVYENAPEVVTEQEKAAPEIVTEQENSTNEYEDEEIDNEVFVEGIDGEGVVAFSENITKPRKGHPISSIKEADFYKITHPRRYYFDINKIDQYPMLKKNKEGTKLIYTVDFTKLAKADLPQAGDTLIFINTGSSTKDVPGSIYANIEGSSAETQIFSTDLKKNENFRNKLTFKLNENLEKVKLNLEYNNPNKYHYLFMTMDRAIFSTDTTEEQKAYKKAVKQGRKVIEWNDKVEEEPAEQESPAPQEEIIETVAEPEKEELSVEEEIIPEETQTEEQEEEIPEEPEEPVPEEENAPQETEETEEIKEQPPVEEKQEAPKEKTPEQLLAEEKARLAEEQAKLEAERAKLELEKAQFAEEKESDKQKELQEQEQLKQKQKLEETIEAVTNTNVKRYEKEYLNDYAVSGYTFDMEEKDPEPTVIYTDPNEADSLGVTLLMDAAKEGNDWKIKALINAGADVNMKDRDGWTALMYAVRYHGNMNCVELLIDAGADIKAQNNYGTSALILASNYNSNPEILKKLLSYYSPNEKDVLKSFIQVLTENQDDEYIQMIKVNLFLDLSVPLNSLFNGKTPLMYAAESGRSTKVIEMLLENSNTGIRSREGKTAFDYASENPKLNHDDIYWSLNNK